MGSPGAAFSPGACIGKIASCLFLFNEAAENVPVALYQVMRSKAPVIHLPFSVFAYENQIR